MKQPELGKKISEWRRAKGMTQEELVEKCNLNVRTIQRIEAGEVTPRSYTVKALLEALDIQEQQISLEDLKQSVNLTMMFVGLAGGILYFFASFFEIGMEGGFVMGEYSLKMIGYTIAKVLSTAGYILFALGWIKLIQNFPNLLLKYGFAIILSATAIWFVVDILALYTTIFQMEDYFLVKISSFGLFYVLLGMGFIAYKKEFSSMGMVIGALTLVAGVFIFSAIGAVPGMVFLTLAEIGQIGLMIHLIQKLGSRKTPQFQP